MKNIDFKSILIGILGISCFLLLIGQRSDGNLGNISVNSIDVIDDGDTGYIRFYNPQGHQTAYIGNHIKEGGMAQFFNKSGKLVTVIGTDLEDNSDDQNGILYMFNPDEIPVVFLGSGTVNGGVLETYNSNGYSTAYIGTGADDSGGIILYDDEDNIYFLKMVNLDLEKDLINFK